MSQTKFYNDVHVNGELTATTLTPSASSISNSHLSTNAAIARTKLAQDTATPYPIKLTDFRVHDAFETPLPGTSATDDLGLYGGTVGTNSPMLKTYDVKTVGSTTLRARVLVTLPAEYDDGETVTLRAHAGMETTVADTSCTIDFKVYESDEEGGVSADLCATGSQSINSLTLADYDFTITATDLVAGDVLDIRMDIAVNDGASGTAVAAVIGALKLLLDVRG